MKLTLSWAVFLVQSALAVLFFASLGSAPLDAALLAAIGAVLEIVKRVSWREWRASRVAVGLVLGLTLAAVSALAAIGYAKAARRRQVMVATSSIGPGALNMVTAAAVASVRIPPPAANLHPMFLSQVSALTALY